MLDPALQTGMILGLQRVINTALRYDPGTQQQLQALNHKRIGLHCLSPVFSVYIEFCDRNVLLSGQSEALPDCEISARAADLFAFLQRPSHTLADSGVKVNGDVALLHYLQALLRRLDIDWEAAINDLIGDTGGHLLAQSLRWKARWVKSITESTIAGLPDFLSEELQVMPHRLELEEFYQQVQSLQSDSDRLSKRIAKLHRELTIKAKVPNGASDV